MIDNLALGLSHGLMILAAWRLLTRRDLDSSIAPTPAPGEKPEAGWGVPRGPGDA